MGGVKNKWGKWSSAILHKCTRQRDNSLEREKNRATNKPEKNSVFLPSVHLLNDMKYKTLIPVSLAMTWIPYKYLGCFSLKLASPQTFLFHNTEALSLYR